MSEYLEQSGFGIRIYLGKAEIVCVGVFSLRRKNISQCFEFLLNNSIATFDRLEELMNFPSPTHIAAGLVDVIIYSSPDDKKKNRGFCFLEYESHKAASLAKRRLGTGRIKV